MDSITNIVSSIKNCGSNSLHTYSSLIDTHMYKDQEVNSVLSNANYPSPSVLQYFKLLVSPTFSTREVLFNDPSTNYTKIAESIITALDTYLDDKLQAISTTDQHITLQNFETENPILYIQDEDNVFFLEENPSEEYFIDLLNLKEKVRL
jgi:hypothetical protein